MSGKREGTTKCGWCMTNDHDHCRGPIEYYGKTWVCTCECRTPKKGK